MPDMKEVAQINNDFLRNPIPDESSIGDILRNIHSQGLEPKDYDRIDITVDGQGYMYLWLHEPKTPKTPKSGEGPAKREGTPIASLEATGCKAPKTQQGQRRITHPGGWPFNSY